jgi:hypothetical protein
MKGELNENESKPEDKNLFQSAVEKTVDLSENKTSKAIGIWWKYILVVIGTSLTLFAYFYGTTKNKIDNGFVETANELGIGFKYFRGAIKDSKGNIITTASCTLNYSDSEGKSFSKKNDTTDMTGYYLFKIPMNSKEMILNVSKNPSDKKGFPQTLDENETDVLKTIIYP